jgi:hypothetical protein
VVVERLGIGRISLSLSLSCYYCCFWPTDTAIVTRSVDRRSSIPRRPPRRGPSPFLINLLTGRRNVCSFIFVSICACWHFSGVDLKKWRDKGQRSFLPAQNKTVHRPNDKVCLPMQRSDDAIKNHVGPSLHPSAGICLLAKLPTHR